MGDVSCASSIFHTTPVVSRKQPAKEEKARTFGLTVETATKDLAGQHGVERVDGVIVTDVERGSIAHKSGLKAGDIITEVNRKSVKSLKDFREALKGADLKKGVLLNFNSNGTVKSEILKESGE